MAFSNTRERAPILPSSGIVSRAAPYSLSLLVVTDSNLVKAGLVDQVRHPIREQVTLDVFAGGEPEPSLQAADACIAHARQFKPDGLIGLGYPNTR